MPAGLTRRLSHDQAHDCEVWSMPTTTTDVGNVTQCPGRGVHEVLHISGAQHVQAFCHLRESKDGFRLGHSL